MTTIPTAPLPSRVLRQMAAESRRRSFRKARRARIADKHSFLAFA